MAVIVLASATGSPGVTTTGLGLTLAWPGDALLVDLDRHCSQAVLAGYLGGLDPSGCGLIAVTAAYRAGGSFVSEIRRRTLPLPATGGDHSFLPGFTSPATTQMFQPLWGELATALAQLSETGLDVLVDAGRIGIDGLPRELLAEADVVALVTRSSLRALAATRLYLPDLLDAVRLVSRADVGLVLIDPGNPYGRREIERQFGLPVLGALAHDPETAATLSDGAPRARHRRRPLEHALSDLASRWQADSTRRRAAVQGVG